MASPPPFPTPERVPGLSFAPQDDELITRYLGPKIARQPLPAATADFIHETDVYAADPAALCAGFPPAYSGIDESSKIWYFFTSPKAKNSRGSRKSRTVGENQGTWHSESRKDVFAGKEKDRLVGYRRSFSHETSSGGKSGWLMMEFGVGANQEDGPVVCKIYKTPRPATAGCSSSARKKRKATDPAAPSARVRRRLNFRSPPATPNDDFLNESQRQYSEAEEQTPAFDPISFLADGHALSTVNCYDTSVFRPRRLADCS
ncbi:NAC domain-containing protein 68-like [Lolium perenne]|uniref:NAC domain-containing protein 68-like n=1 Tax=Lolium perenne TaxID=4522 RepID=UPI0021F58C8E|nr:NAC domain-containing protein 68-like [Lolium perenne]